MASVAAAVVGLGLKSVKSRVLGTDQYWIMQNVWICKIHSESWGTLAMNITKLCHELQYKVCSDIRNSDKTVQI